MVRTLLLTLVVALSLFLPAGAAGAPALCQAPPGSAAVDQYCESIPQAGGDTSGSGTSSGDSNSTGAGSGGRSALSADTIRELGASGGDGKAIAAFSEKTGVARKHNAGVAGAPKDASPAKLNESTRSNDPLAALTSSIESGNTVGGAFVWILLGITIGAVAVGWLAFRSRSASGTSDGDEETHHTA